MAALPPGARSKSTTPKPKTSTGTQKKQANGQTKPVTDDEREKVKLLFEQGKGRNEIAKEIGRSSRTVTQIVKAFGGEFDTSKTVEATASRVAKMKERRVELAEKLLGDVEKLQERLWSPHTYYERGDGVMLPVTLPLPPLRDMRDGYSALQIALKGHMELLSGSTDSTIESKRSVLATLIDGIKSTVAADKAAGIAPPDMSSPTAEQLADPNGTAAQEDS